MRPLPLTRRRLLSVLEHIIDTHGPPHEAERGYGPATVLKIQDEISQYLDQERAAMAEAQEEKSK